MQLESIRSEAKLKFSKCKSREELEALRVQFLGKKGSLATMLKGMGALEPEKRKKLGAEVNSAKSEVEALIEKAKLKLAKKAEGKLLREKIDITLPGKNPAVGSLHPITQTANEILEILSHLGFDPVRGPEIEHDFYNFEALNVPEDHPAREMQDTFYIAPEVVLRTQTSPVQIRSMLALEKPPMRVACFGKVFRHDQDATHSPMFHQIEILCVDKGISFADLKGTLTLLVQRLFSQDSTVRLRPSFFPFTEPSAEVDMSCFSCKGKGCRLCKDTGWIEILGCGLVHPSVLKTVGVDPEVYSGFAAGLGIERIAMLRYGIPHIGLFYDNDLRFLKQF
ncbi:MAG: phenylalanine--tRNA ligase subunit alpha [Deltaproteobacteria bacterium]|nr:phenylalanine--tRNA ligase subunit alpha [Deltaproteobacteria bacterium]